MWAPELRSLRVREEYSTDYAELVFEFATKRTINMKLRLSPDYLALSSGC
jgi:hypothetical protein